MQKFKIPFQEIGSIPQLIKDFLNLEIPKFVDYTFSLQHVESVVKQKSSQFSSEQRQILVQVLRNQLQNIALSEKQSQNLEFLLHKNTFTVTTGHQLNLFSGPVFFIYKILYIIQSPKTIKLDYENNNFNRPTLILGFHWL